MNGEHQHWLQQVAPMVAPLAKIALKVPPSGRNRSLVARTVRCGECIRLPHNFGLKYLLPRFMSCVIIMLVVNGEKRRKLSHGMRIC